ncbi:hypothetical protein FQR65_LT17668 [Abscondita terminalis]|nr:hypothetical protein FQR65_LT17668 [Abscondita terminalis]
MDNETCRVLIKLYGTKDLLWNSKSPHYHNKSLRQDAWNEISSIMVVPVPELKKKMTTLMASYRREKSRIGKSLITGSGANEVYVSKWFAFDDFNFMKDKNLPNETSDTMPKNIPTTQNCNDKHATIPSPSDSANQYSEEPIPSGTDGEPVRENSLCKAPNTSKNMKRKRNIEEESPMLKKAFQILTESSSSSTSSFDPYFSYGQHIANELRKYDQRTFIYVKQAINKVIFEADLGKYTNYGHYFPSYEQTNYNRSSQNSTSSYSPSTHPSVPSPQPPIQSPQPPVPSPQASILSPQSLIPTTQNCNDKHATIPSPSDSANQYSEEPIPSGTDGEPVRENSLCKAPNTSKNMKRKRNIEEESPMLKKAFQILTESSSSSTSSFDPYFSYGQHIANELRKYDQRTFIYVKQAINKVIFEADLGKYTNYGHYFPSYEQTNYNRSSQNSTSSYSPSTHPSVPSPQPPIQSPQPPVPSPQASILSPQSLIPTTQNCNDKHATIPSPSDSANQYSEEPIPSGTDGEPVRENSLCKAPNTSKNMKRKRNIEEESPMLKKAFQILTESSSSSTSSFDPYFSYGQHIANELRKYDQRTFIYVKQAINKVIFEADLGKYTNYGHYFPSYEQTNYNRSSQNSTSSYSPSTHPSVPSPQPPIQSPQPPVPSPQASILSPQSLVSSPQPPFESETELINAINFLSE